MSPAHAPDDPPPDTLAGKLLVAMPAMPDPRFAHSVILLCAHSADGAMGVMVNKPLPDLNLQKLLEHLELPLPGTDSGLGDAPADMAVHFGGPVETARGFVLHSPDVVTEEGSLDVASGIVLSTSVEILAEMARGQGPAQVLTALGYAGWGAGQLEDELQAGGWLLTDATPTLVFGTDDSLKWSATLSGMGVDPRLLSGATGHA
jgi:putative transcriptional regulator